MATKSFLKNIIIKDSKSAKSFISALENAEKKGRKKITINSSVKEINNKESIKKMFGE
ncbi:MAG: hypothetical protein J6D03_02940 [Clostridia bacterium]|nr:hypothetical protein [Clostridia bacterium]